MPVPQVGKERRRPGPDVRGLGRHRARKGEANGSGKVAWCHQPCLLCPPRSTPTRDTASAALSPVSTMKSRCCTFSRSTSEGPRCCGRKFRAQVASLPPPGGPGGKDGVALRGPLEVPSLLPPLDIPVSGSRAAAFGPDAFYHFLNAPGSPPAASRLPGQGDEADTHEALPRATPPHRPQERAEPCWALERRGPPPPGPAAHPAQQHACLSSPPAHLLLAFCFGDVFPNLKDKARGA